MLDSDLWWMAVHPRGMRRAAVALVLLLMMQTVAAAPPPGDPEVVNDICSTWGGGNGICDDYDSSLDATTSDEWVEGQVRMVMETASTIEMSLELGIYELPRDELDLVEIDLESDSNPSDGIPADYIRNYRDLVQDGSSVEDRMVDYVEEIIQQIVDENFPDATIGPIQPTSEIVFFSRENASCTYNPDIDSIDEEADRENNPFYPPICLRSALSLNIDPANIGMDPNTGDVDRMMEGLMVMGGEVISNFTTIATAGHYLEYVMVPPAYASVSEVNAPGEVFQSEQGQQSYTGARVALNNLAASAFSPPTSVNLIATLDSGVSPPDWQFYADPSLRLELIVDVRDRMNSRIDMQIYIHHLSAETLTDWGLNLETSTIRLDSVTSDGIRMFDSELDVDVDRMLTTLPIDSLSDTFSEALGVDVLFQTPTFAPSHDSGGLMFIHNPGSTCEENLAYRYCLGNSGPMASTYPVELQTSSMPSEMQVSNIVNQLIQHAEGDISSLDLSIMTDEDLAALMSVLELEVEVDLAFLQDILPENFPSADIKMTVLLPEWLDMTGSNSDTLEFTSNSEGVSTQSFSLRGSRPYDWRHAICLESGRGASGDSTECTDESEDLICGSTQETCVSIDVDMEIERFALRETQAAVEFEFTADVTLEIYRLGVNIDEENIEVSPIPADLIRRIISVGDRRSGGLLAGSEQQATIPLASGDYNLEISNAGLAGLSDALMEEVEVAFAELEEIGSQDLIMGSQTFDSKLEIESLPIALEIQPMEMPLDMELSDTDPVEITVRVSSSSLTIALVDGAEEEVRIGLAPAAIKANPLASAISDLDLVFSDYGISAESAVFYSIVPPIMEHTLWGLIKSSVRLQITMPDTIRLLSFESEKGLGYIDEIDGKQVLIYRTPVCPNADTWSQCYRQHDTVSWSVEVSYLLILGEIAPYIFVVIVFLGIAISRWKRRRDARKAASKDAKEAMEEQLLELEFAAQMGELEEKLVIEASEDSEDQDPKWWDQSDLV